MDKKLLEKYAELIVKIGVNIQKGQILVVTAPVENYEIVEKIAEIAYKEGAREVIPNWIDEKLSRLTFLNAPDDLFDEVHEWKKIFYIDTVKKNAAYIRLAGSDPNNLKGVDQNRIVRMSKSMNAAVTEYRERLMSNKNVWCVASAPTEAWAVNVFPNNSKEEAVKKLWDAIFKINKIYEDNPIIEWEKHKNNLLKRVQYLNENKFKKLIYKNSLGTDLIIELPEKHVWAGGEEISEGGIKFMANIPTEEVFTLPKKDGVNGVVYGSKPFVYNGVIIDGFKVEFKDGKVIKYSAEKGHEALKSLVELDEGSSHLGEVALVPVESTISRMNILFYNTLFDENASCHLAFGEAYPMSIEGGGKMTREELTKEGVNNSIAHEDFMIGTEDLLIIGINKDGEKIKIFDNGNFAF